MSAPTRILVLQRPTQPLELACARLRAWGCTLHACAGTDELFALLSTVPIDLVLIDAGAPHGMAVVAQIKGDARLRHLPVVAAAEDAGVVASHALAIGADDVFALPLEDAELYARIRALARLAAMEAERRRRDVVLAEFDLAAPHEAPGVPALDRLGILLIGPAGPEQIIVSTALGSAATLAYADTAERGLERLRRQDLDVVVITGGRNQNELQRLCVAIRADGGLFDLPVVLIDRAERYPDRALPFQWGVSDVLFQPFHPEILRLRIQGWVRQQRLRRRLRGVLRGAGLPPVADRLTGLYAHGFLHAYLDYRIAEARHVGAPLAVCGLALVGMRHINAQHGFAAGDQVLAQVGAIVARTSRAEDLPARVEGDRFCVVPNGASLEEAQAVAERLAEFLTHTPLPVGRDQALRIGVRTGAAALAPGDDPASLVARTFEPPPAGAIRAAS